TSPLAGLPLTVMETVCTTLHLLGLYLRPARPCSVTRNHRRYAHSTLAGEAGSYLVIGFKLGPFRASVKAAQSTEQLRQKALYCRQQTITPGFVSGRLWRRLCR